MIDYDTITPLPVAEALKRFTEPYHTCIEVHAQQYFTPGTLIFPCKWDAVNPYHKEYFEIISLHQDDEVEEMWILGFEDIFLGGGADGDCESFLAYNDAVARAREVMREYQFNLNPEYDAGDFTTHGG